MLPTNRKAPRVISPWVKGATALMVTALVDMVVAFSTAYWATWSSKTSDEHGGYGLWKMWRCGGKPPQTGDDVIKQKLTCEHRMADMSFPGWYIATQVMETLGLAGMVTSLTMLLLYIFLPQWERNKTAMSSLVAISYLSGLFIFVGLVVFGVFVVTEIAHQAEWMFSWSFSLAVTAIVLNEVAASVLITETKRLYKEHNERVNMTKSIQQELRCVLPHNT